MDKAAFTRGALAALAALGMLGGCGGHPKAEKVAGLYVAEESGVVDSLWLNKNGHFVQRVHYVGQLLTADGEWDIGKRTGSVELWRPFDDMRWQEKDPVMRRVDGWLPLQADMFWLNGTLSRGEDREPYRRVSGAK